jgi:hypothetical protein
MDRETARFILRSFRPDGADAADPDFAAALAVAAADRELGEWLAHERAADAAFSEALGRIGLPEGLHSEILTALEVARGGEMEADEMDGLWIGALASVEVPAGLRGEVLSAMESSSAVVPKGRFWRRWGVPMAAAAGIALALVINRSGPATGGGGTVSVAPVASGAVPIAHVEEEAIATLESPGFSLDLKEEDQQALFRFIRAEGRPCPQGAVPKGLREIPGLGCRCLDVDGKKGAIVCFLRGENDVVHLIVFRRDDVAADLPECGHPKLSRHGKWSVAQWQQDGRVFLLLGSVPEDRLDALF